MDEHMYLQKDDLLQYLPIRQMQNFFAHIPLDFRNIPSKVSSVDALWNSRSNLLFSYFRLENEKHALTQD